MYCAAKNTKTFSHKGTKDLLHKVHKGADRLSAMRPRVGGRPEPQAVWVPLVWLAVPGARPRGVGLQAGRPTDRPAPFVTLVQEALCDLCGKTVSVTSVVDR